MNRFTLMIAAFIIWPACAPPANAQSDLPVVICDACRSPDTHPRDFRNFAYNQFFGPEGTMTYDDADIFRIENRAGEAVVVDINMSLTAYEVNLIVLPITLPYPLGLEVQIILIYENGDQRSYRIDPRAHDGALPVGGVRNRHRNAFGNWPHESTGGNTASSRNSEYSARTSGPGAVCGITRIDGGRPRRTCINP